MCLEDKFLFALYNQAGFVPGREMAEDIAITENALLSIVHRIAANYPDFIFLQNDHTNHFMLSPNKELQKEVRMFLAEGGFTIINEQELREYYDMEIQLQSKRERIYNRLKKFAMIKWVAGLSILAGAAVSVAALSKHYKGNSIL